MGSDEFKLNVALRQHRPGGPKGRRAQDGHLDFHTAPELRALTIVEVLLYVRRNHRLIRDGIPGRPPRLSHSAWALSTDDRAQAFKSVWKNSESPITIFGPGVGGSFSKWPHWLRFTSTETVGLLGTEAQDGHLDFHTAPELWGMKFMKCCFTSTETVRTIMDGEPRTATSTVTQLLSSEHWRACTSV